MENEGNRGVSRRPQPDEETMEKIRGEVERMWREEEDGRKADEREEFPMQEAEKNNDKEQYLKNNEREAPVKEAEKREEVERTKGRQYLKNNEKEQYLKNNDKEQFLKNNDKDQIPMCKRREPASIFLLHKLSFTDVSQPNEGVDMVQGGETMTTNAEMTPIKRIIPEIVVVPNSREKVKKVKK